MEHATNSPSDQQRGRPATERTAAPSRAATVIDNRPEAIVQRELAHALSNSPRVVAQRTPAQVLHQSPQVSALRAFGAALNTSPRMVAQALERDADQMGASAARGDAAARRKLAPVVQRKSDVRLMSQLDKLLGWAMRQIGDPLAGYDANFKSLFRRINDYDRSTDGRPAQQLVALDAMIADANTWYETHAVADDDDLRFVQLQTILLNERAVVEQQSNRLNRFTATPESPYEQMTEEGMVWSHPDYEHNTGALDQTGKGYFDRLSAMNIESMRPVAEEWFTAFVNRATEALSKAVVNHYTTSARAQTMLGGGMKSKVMLEKDSPTFKHNTSAYDDFGLANSGFVFFFIESPDSRMRSTRFAEGDDGATPARISIPITDSGLCDRGWIMLSDFAQREYPDIMTNEAGDKHTSWLPTRESEEKKKPGREEFTQKVRHFEPGLGDINDQDIESTMAIKDSDRRQASFAVTPQARGDANSKQTYSGPSGKLEIPDRMFNNVLVGPDIIPGLATRAALEVARMAVVNPGLADHFKTLADEALMTFMLKDLFRPQAMIPNGVPISEEHIQR